MANLGGGPYGISDDANALGVELGSLSLHHQNLIRKGMIYSVGTGLIDFTVPMFDAHLPRAMQKEGRL